MIRIGLRPLRETALTPFLKILKLNTNQFVVYGLNRFLRLTSAVRAYVAIAPTLTSGLVSASCSCCVASLGC